MRKIMLLFIVMIVVSGCKKINMDFKQELIKQLSGTSWKISDVHKQNKVEFEKTFVRVGTGGLLSAPKTTYEVMSQKSNYVLLSIYQNYGSYFMGIQAVNPTTIKLLIWQDKKTPKSQDSLNLVEKHGELYILQNAWF
ncbi:MAG: hypothetical protein ACRCTQ_06815 [Brevinemataceae bacterium]